LQGEHFGPAADALRAGDLDAAPVTPGERLLLEFVGKLTEHAYRITDGDVAALREAGWSDEQVAEAVYDGALFNLFVRLADAFDIEPPAVYEPSGIPTAARKDSSTGSQSEPSRLTGRGSSIPGGDDL
jgi:hypothetical protein